MNNIDEAMRNALALKDQTENVDEKISCGTDFETQLAVAIAERNVYKKLHSQSLTRITRILNKRSKEK